MKLTAFFFLAAFLQVSASGLAQTVNLKVSRVPLEKVMKEITAQTGYEFFYQMEQLKEVKPVTITVVGGELKPTLDKIFADQPVTYAIANRTIILSARPVPEHAEHDTTPQPSTGVIRGTVTEEDGKPLAGATISIKKGKASAATTNALGIFSLAVKPGDVVILSFVGHQSRELRISEDMVRSGMVGTLSLVLSNSPLDDVQVVAYGTNTQRYNVGSVTKVTSEEIEKQPVSNVLMALAGRVPGLEVDQTSGLPGSSIKIQIRGQNTLPPTNSGVPPLDNPLFIVDGVPFAPNNTNTNLFMSLVAPGSSGLYNNQYGGFSPFSYIDPGSIESIEVLRDADATSIYGSRGANGVILITTKKGHSGKATLSTHAYLGQSRSTRTMDFMNTQQYLDLRREAFRNDGITPDISTAPDLLIFDTTKFTDWKKKIIGNAAQTADLSANLSGGTENTQFLIGGSYHDESFIFSKGLSDKRFSVNTGFKHTSSDKKLNVSVSANYSYGNNVSSAAYGALKSYTLIPNYPHLLDNNNNIVWDYKGFILDENPMQYLAQRYSMKANNLTSNISVGYQLYKGLLFRTSFGFNAFSTNEYASFPKSARNPAYNYDPKGQASFGTSDAKSWIVEPQLEYNKLLGKGKLNVLMGGTLQRQSNSSLSLNGDNYSNDALLGTLSAAGSVTMDKSTSSLYKYISAFGRINYIWDRKYILSLTGREDGSSRFGPGKRIGKFGSLAGGWIFSEEGFVKKNIGFLSYGKLRGSYGTTGSDAIGDFQYTAYWAPANYPYLDIPGYRPINLYKPDYSWAVTKKLEAGIDIGFLQDNILFNVTWYRNRCGNQLVNYLLPIQTGFNGVTQNFPAVVQNKGWEILVTSRNIKRKNFNWTSSFNLTIPDNKLVAFPGIESSSYFYQYTVGQSLSSIRLYNLIGVDPNTGLFTFESKNGPTSDPVYIDDFRTRKDLDPVLYGGFRNTVTLGGFELDVFIQFKKQTGQNYLQTLYNGSNIGLYNNYNYPTALLSRWQKAGDISDIQKVTADYSGLAQTSAFAYSMSNGAYTDASFVRVKNLSLSYSLPAKALKAIKAQTCRLYLTGQNLFTITGYKGNDPETQNVYGVPPLKTWVAGIQLTL